MFLGEYHHTIDEKGRLTLPVKVREQLGNDFVVTRGLDYCLFVYPKEEWNQVVSKYKELPNTKDARNFMRFLLSGATISNLDKQGRVNIPIPLNQYASLEKDCVIIGVNDHLEIWNQTTWEQFISTNEENFSDIADKLFTTELR